MRDDHTCFVYMRYIPNGFRTSPWIMGAVLDRWNLDNRRGATMTRHADLIAKLAAIADDHPHR